MNLKVCLLGAVAFAASLAGCNPEKIEATVPGYIYMDSFAIDYPSPAESGRGAQKVTEAWVYVNDELHSVTPLPGTVPIPDVGNNQRISIGPGIRQNGIAATRAEYPFYERYEVLLPEIMPDSTYNLQPKTRYTDAALFPYMEDFESSLVQLDSVSSSSVNIRKESLNRDTEAYGRFVGKAVLTADKPGLKLASSELYALPKGGAPVYVELDYKCNAEFIFGVIYQLPQQNPLDYPVVWIQPTNRETGTPEWNKMYIELTPHVSSNLTALGFGFTLTASHDPSNTESVFYFDNLKIVHR